jgi:endonuclease/exonuclease/phosphatase (EEP) superfamily protein YafD
VLLLIVILLRWVGESWWATGVGLYLPRIAFVAPLPVLVVLLLVLGKARLLYTQLAALLIFLFPMMGLVLPWPRSPIEGAPKLRVLSYNVNQQYGGADNILAEIDRYTPDVALLQEAHPSEEFLDLLRARYANVAASTQFIVASRFAIVSSTDPDKLPFFGRMRSPRFMQYVLETPLGQIAFYSVHPLSPRDAFYQLRGSGLRHEILSGRFFAANSSPAMQTNTALRESQIKAVSELAANETLPVVIAGDTNLPGQSGILRRYLSAYRDAFTEASWGFGYTFPANRTPWMRIDRIMAGRDLRFVSFEVGSSDASDHRCVVADIQRNSL